MVVFDLLLDAVVTAIVVVATACIGVLAHESLHWLIGHFVGGSPKYTSRWYGVPTAVKFVTPENMSDREIQFAGGAVLIFPFLLFLFLLDLKTAQIADSVVLTGVLGFLLGSSVVSGLDMMAFSQPAIWRRFSQGEKIDISDFGY